MAHRLSFWEDKNVTFEESKKYSSRMEFYKKAHGAYVVSKDKGWLDEMTWLNNKNVYTDPVDTVYKYHFINENAVYIGRTIYLALRDRQHRTRQNDTVYKFAKEHDVEIPKIDVIESGLTVVQGAERERYWENYYKDNGFTLLNKQPCGSIGYMAKGKWSKNKCFEEAKKYKTRSEFERNASQAYHKSMENGWIDEMTWMPKIENHPKGFWKNKNNIINEAKKYKSVTEFQKNAGGAFNAARRLKIFDEFTWFNKNNRLPNYYWKNKENCLNEAKKYKSKNEFQKANQSAYWASLKYGYLKEFTWLAKNKVTKQGSLKNKEYIMEIAKKYNSKSELMKNNKSVYDAAQRYGWLKELDLLYEKI